MLDPLKILEEEWRNIKKGIKTSKHDYHSFVLSTIRNNNPDSRTVILRDFDVTGPSMWFHTDKRSKKILDLNKNEEISALFYDRLRKVQLRISGSANVDESRQSNQEIWKSMSPESKLCYMGLYAPSEPLIDYAPNILVGKSAYEINDDDDNLGLTRFCRIKINVNSLDWLQLDYKGHKRLEFNFDEKIDFGWIAS
ncbi:MAG: pyridoxamine 5'-phosphate oxidase family protein [Candidatus Neomarinimicrobiota bacterium]